MPKLDLPDLPPPSEALRQQIARALSVSPLALASLPEPMRQRMLEDAERSKVAERLKAIAASIRQSAVSVEYFCARDGHHLIPDTDDLFVCVICTKRFRLAD